MLLPIALVAAALAPQSGGTAAFRQACLDAQTDALALNVAAHPDDEAARSMVYLRRTRGLRTVALFSTCGEGGQNAVGRDIGAALAKRRVMETLAAASHTDTEVRWLGFADFGFSKSLEETLRVWGEQALCDAMLTALREIRPDIVFTNHDTVRGHGHHRATAYAIEKVLPIYSAEVGRKVPLFQRPADDKDEGPLQFDVARLDPGVGKTFARQAHEGLLEHASQGPWSPHDPARVRVERWKLVWPKDDPSLDVTQVLDTLPSYRRQGLVNAPLVDDPDAALFAVRLGGDHSAQLKSIAEALAAFCRNLDAGNFRDLDRRTRVARRMAALERAWLYGHDVSIEAYALRDRVPLFGRAAMRVAVHSDDPRVIERFEVTWQNLAAAPAVDGPLGERVRELTFHLLPPGLRADRERDPVTGARVLRPQVNLRIAGVDLVVEPRVRIVPVEPLDLAWDREVCVIPAGTKGARRLLSLDLDYHGDSAPTGSFHVTAPHGVTCEVRPAKIELSTQRRDARALVRVTIDDAGKLPPDAELIAHYGARSERLPLRVVDVTVPARKVALVRGPDDTLLRALQDLGVEHVELDERALAVADLEFDTVLLDMRTAGHRRDLRDHRERLLEFCAQGGRVVAFYHKAGEWNAREGWLGLAPFELTVGDERVSEEDAEVTFLQPDHPLLRAPHPIGPGDFAGWVQERGLNFPSKWAPEWLPLLRMADRGEKPLDGALLVARHGRGEFVYCSLALYRQWRAGHAGALRLLINLIGARH